MKPCLLIALLLATPSAWASEPECDVRIEVIEDTRVYSVDPDPTIANMLEAQPYGNGIPRALNPTCPHAGSANEDALSEPRIVTGGQLVVYDTHEDETTRIVWHGPPAYTIKMICTRDQRACLEQPRLTTNRTFARWRGRGPQPD